MSQQSDYEATADELTKRILALIPTNPKILKMDNAFDLFKVKGFNCDDLQPSLTQAGIALRKAQEQYKDEPTIK